jgi:hypothetical protein
MLAWRIVRRVPVICEARERNYFFAIYISRLNTTMEVTYRKSNRILRHFPVFHVKLANKSVDLAMAESTQKQ